MNNQRLLAGLLMAVLTGSGARMSARTPHVMTIRQLFEIAEANNATIRSSLSAENEARQEISVARSGRLPDINASLSLSYIGDGFTTARNFSDRRKAPIPHLGDGFSVSISQPVYTGSAITDGIRMAEMKSTAARYSTEMQRDNIRFRIAGYYLDIYKYSNLRSVVEQNIARARKVLSEMHARFEQGTALHNDITRYELLVSDLRLQLTRIDNTIDILNRNLTITAGLPDSITVVPDSTLLEQALPCDTETSWQQTATENSPALLLARSDVEISRKAEDLVKSERRPKIGIQAGWTIDGPILVEVPPINRNLSYWYAGVGISYNFASLYKSNRSLSRRRAATRSAIDRLDVERENVTLAVNDSYIRYLEAYEVVNTQQKNVELADRNYRTTVTRYNAGMALITDMLDAANSRIAAEQQLVNARIDVIYYYYKLLFTSGKI